MCRRIVPKGACNWCYRMPRDYTNEPHKICYTEYLKTGLRKGVCQTCNDMILRGTEVGTILTLEYVIDILNKLTKNKSLSKTIKELTELFNLSKEVFEDCYGEYKK